VATNESYKPKVSEELRKLHFLVSEESYVKEHAMQRKVGGWDIRKLVVHCSVRLILYFYRMMEMNIESCSSAVYNDQEN
jgi:hypothetical protein